MSATTTRGKRATATVAVPAVPTAPPAPAKRSRIVQLPDSWAPALHELEEISRVRGELEAREKQLKQAVKDAVGKNADRGETIVVKVAGATLAKVTLSGRTNVDQKLLRETFPEAWEAATGETEYQVVKTA